ncbi:hypothetical protein FKM82_027451 [Ascaphus truei]
MKVLKYELYFGSGMKTQSPSAMLMTRIGRQMVDHKLLIKGSPTLLVYASTMECRTWVLDTKCCNSHLGTKGILAKLDFKMPVLWEGG